MGLPRSYRFFYHYNKFTGDLTIHYKKQCIPVKNVVCRVVTETKWNKSQPKLVVQGFAHNISIIQNTAFIN